MPKPASLNHLPAVKYDWYLSGPITSYGDREANLTIFADWAKALRKLGLRVFSPPEHEPAGWGWGDYLRRDLKYLVECAAVATLPNWQKSKGAVLEIHIAEALGMRVVAVQNIPPPGAAVHVDTWDNFKPEECSLLPDSGSRRQFDTGSQRDSRKGKGRFDLLPPIALMLIAKHFEAGAEKYDERNWEKGQKLSVYFDSALRHLITYMCPRGPEAPQEDHLVAAAWNLLAAIETRYRAETYLLPSSLLDIPPQPETKTNG
jgi:hypothetical protein